MADKIEIQIIATDKNVKKITEETAKGFRKMRQGADHASKGFLGIRQHAENLRRGLFSLKGAVAGLVAGFAAYKALGVAKSFLDVASSVENYRIRLTTLLGSQQAANEAMKFFNDIAAKTPSTLGEVIESGTTLIAMGADYKTWIPVLNDLAAVMGMKMPEAASALGRAYAAGAGAADIFRERGILQIIKDFAKLKYNVDDITKVDLPKFQKIMFEAFTDPGGKIAGAGAALSKSWTGMISMVEDAWFRFRQKVMDTDVFLTLKASLQKFLDALGIWKEEGKIDEWAEGVAEGALTAFEKIAVGAGYVAKAFQGWQMIFAGLKEAYLFFKHLYETLMVQWAENLGGGAIFGKTAEEWRKQADETFAALDRTNEKLKELSTGDPVAKVRDAFAKLRQEVEETKKKQAEQAAETEKTAGATKETGQALEYIVEGTKKVVGDSETAAGNFAVMKTTSEEASESFKERSEELEKQNKLLQEQIRLLKQAALAATEAAKPGITSHRYGGLVLSRQLGGLIPGYGGGDKVPGLLEPGEFVMRKEAVRALGTDALNALNRGGGEKGYFTVDFRFPQGSLPGVKISADEMGEAFIEFIKHSEKTRGHF